METESNAELWKIHCIGDGARSEGWRSGLMMESDAFSVLYLTRPERSDAVRLAFLFYDTQSLVEVWIPVTDDLYRALDVGDDTSEGVIEGTPTRFLVYARLAFKPGNHIRLDGPVSLATMEAFLGAHEEMCRESGQPEATITTFAVPVMMGKKPEGLQ